MYHSQPNPNNVPYSTNRKHRSILNQPQTSLHTQPIPNIVPYSINPNCEKEKFEVFHEFFTDETDQTDENENQHFTRGDQPEKC